LDDPTWFQLLSSLDKKSFLRSCPSLSISAKGKQADNGPGCIWIWDADQLRASLADALSNQEEGRKTILPESQKIMNALLSEESDIVVWAGQDGSLILRSIVVCVVLQVTTPS